jgi:hypothetical protein
MRASDMSRYLKSSDVKTTPKIGTIAYLVEAEEVGQEKKRKPVLYFEDGVKPLVVNLTNFQTIEDAFGDSNDWPGHKIRVFCAQTTFGGKRTDCIRVEPIVPKPAAKPSDLDDDLDDEVAA